MTDKKEEKVEKQETEARDGPISAQSPRRIVIETDGTNFKLIQAQCTNLELKEICRQIIMKLGG